VKIAMVSQPIDILEAPADRLSSITILTYNLATLLSRRGHDVTIYGSSTQKAPESTSIGTGESKNLRIVFVRSPRLVHRAQMGLLRRASSLAHRRISFIGSACYDPAYAVRVALDARRHGTDVIHVHNFSQYGPIIKAIYPKAAMALHMHCLWLSHFNPTIIRRRLETFDEVICCSNFIRDAARRAFPDLSGKFKTIYNGVDTDRFDGRRDHGDGRDVYCIGRVSPEKGIHVLIKAFKQVVREVPEARLFIVGSTDAMSRHIYQTLGSDPILETHVGPIYERHEFPPYLRMLQDESAQHLDKRIHFVGSLSHSDLIERLRSAALVVQSSLCGEAFGMPAAEAMAMGLPVVVARAGGLTEIVEHGVSGLVVERGSVEGLAAAIVELLRSPARCRSMGTVGRRRVLERFAFPDLARQLEGRYTALLAAAGRTAGAGVTGPRHRAAS
jgi:glycosyltransferase involved in cell wall biosynthesis